MLNQTLQRSQILEKYLKLGILYEKINISNNSSVAIWSISRNCEVGGKGNPSSLEFLTIEGNKVIATYENNRYVTMLIYSEITNEMVNKINSSNGILVSYETYGKPYYRFGYIPTQEDVNQTFPNGNT
jgi:hypothetical protein